jgi:tyrosyl-DNA phosphodiesterase-1
VPSIPGRHIGNRMKELGIGKVEQVMKKYNMIKDPIITYQSTSLGIVDRKLVEEIYFGFCPNEKNFSLEKFKLIYPTKQYIEEETGGQTQVLFLTSDNYQKSEVCNKILHKFDTNPNNAILGCIPHLKLMIIESGKMDTNKGILYMGSHNMTKAAWGKMEKKGTQVYIANSELGVIFFNVDLKKMRMWCPFKYPPEVYGENDVPFLKGFQN